MDRLNALGREATQEIAEAVGRRTHEQLIAHGEKVAEVMKREFSGFAVVMDGQRIHRPNGAWMVTPLDWDALVLAMEAGLFGPLVREPGLRREFMGFPVALKEEGAPELVVRLPFDRAAVEG